VRMADRPVVFIGSSSEGKAIAEAVQVSLAQDSVSEPIAWHQGLFTPGSVTLEALVSQINKFDFAVLIFSPDDFIESRVTTAQAPRDNVLIELGLFIGRLGRHRTFVIFNGGVDIKVPSDLAGVTLLPFLPPVHGTLQSALGPACAQIKEAIIQQGRLDRTV